MEMDERVEVMVMELRDRAQEYRDQASQKDGLAELLVELKLTRSLAKAQGLVLADHGLAEEGQRGQQMLKRLADLEQLLLVARDLLGAETGYHPGLDFHLALLRGHVRDLDRWGVAPAPADGGEGATVNVGTQEPLEEAMVDVLLLRVTPELLAMSHPDTMDTLKRNAGEHLAVFMVGSQADPGQQVDEVGIGTLEALETDVGLGNGSVDLVVRLNEGAAEQLPPKWKAARYEVAGMRWTPAAHHGSDAAPGQRLLPV